MKPRLPWAALVLITLLSTPALAKVLAEGKASRGFYWQKIKQADGKVVYQCRQSGNSKFQKKEKCEAAKAMRPR
jgi:hypothetical protein